MKKMDKNMEKMETRLLPVGSIRVAERIRKDNGGLRNWQTISASMGSSTRSRSWSRRRAGMCSSPGCGA